jgi:2-keto-3-deoxy-L-rhamnonate aldolase RhmA
MSGKLLKEKLARGDTVFGTFFQYVTNPAIVEILPEKGLDFVMVTAEHNALDAADFLPVRWALAAKGIACLARIHSRDPEDVAKICDSYDGVVVPYVEDVEQARRLAAAAVYRPLKGEALERVLSDGTWPSDKTRQYVTNVRSRDTVFVPMIESLRSVRNLDAICSIPGVSAVFVGPNDLTVTMGIPDEYDHPDFVAILQQIIDVAAKHRVAAGCHFSRLEQAQRTIQQGARFVPYGSDLLFIREGLGQSLARLREKAAGQTG